MKKWRILNGNTRGVLSKDFRTFLVRATNLHTLSIRELNFICFEHRQIHSGKKNAGGVVNQAHTLSLLAGTPTRSVNVNQDGWTATPAGLAEARLPP